VFLYFILFVLNGHLQRNILMITVILGFFFTS